MALPNVSVGESTLRGLLGVVLVILAMDVFIFFGPRAGLAAALLLVALAVLMVATAVTRICPVYLVVGKSPVPAEGEG